MFCPKCGSQNVDNAQFCLKCGAQINQGAAPNTGTSPNMGPGPAPVSQTGMQKNVSALLCYVAGWVTGLIFYFIEKDKFVQFHAVQSIITFGALTIIEIIIRVIPVYTFSGIAVIGVIMTIIGIITFVLWILLMVKAYQNQRFKLPLIGDMAEKITNK